MPIEHDSAFGSAYAQLDRKIDVIERDFRSEIGNLNARIETQGAAINARIDAQGSVTGSKIDVLQTSLFERIDKAKNPSNTLQILGLIVPFILAIGSFGGYVANNLSNSITTVALAVDKESRVRQDEFEKESREREESDRKIYEVMQTGFAKVWSKDAQVEFERRIDERNQQQHEYDLSDLARLQGEHDALAATVVPRSEHEQQWKDEQVASDRSRSDMAGSLDRLLAHLNQSDANVAAKLAELDRAVHGYGLTETVKSIEDQMHSQSDKIFELGTLISHLRGATATPNAAGDR